MVEKNRITPYTYSYELFKTSRRISVNEVGDTKVICSATIEERVPPFMRGEGKGWVTAEYAMIPRDRTTYN